MSTEIRTTPDGREVIVTELPDDPLPGLTTFRVYFAADPLAVAYGVTADGAVTRLLLEEHRAKMLSLRQARRIAGIGHGDGDLPPGQRSYVHHIDGDPYNNDPANLMVVRGNEQQR